jgi:hypothetical protein
MNALKHLQYLTCILFVVTSLDRRAAAAPLFPVCGHLPDLPEQSQHRLG